MHAWEPWTVFFTEPWALFFTLLVVITVYGLLRNRDGMGALFDAPVAWLAGEINLDRRGMIRRRLKVYRLDPHDPIGGPHVGIAVTHPTGASSAVTLTRDEARQLAEALAQAAMRSESGPAHVRAEDPARDGPEQALDGRGWMPGASKDPPSERTPPCHQDLPAQGQQPYPAGAGRRAGRDPDGAPLTRARLGARSAILRPGFRDVKRSGRG